MIGTLMTMPEKLVLSYVIYSHTLIVVAPTVSLNIHLSHRNMFFFQQDAFPTVKHVT